MCVYILDILIIILAHAPSALLLPTPAGAPRARRRSAHRGCRAAVAPAYARALPTEGEGARGDAAPAGAAALAPGEIPGRGGVTSRRLARVRHRERSLAKGGGYVTCELLNM